MELHTLLLALQIAVPDSARLAAIARFHPGTTLRLQGPTIGFVEAKLRLPLGDSITLGRWRPDGRVPLGAVDSIWVLHSGVDKAVVAGAVFVGLAFGVLGAELGSMGDYPTRSDQVRGFLVGAGVGAIVGGSLGAMVGAADESWERVYP